MGSGAEPQVERSEQRFQALVQRSWDILSILDASGALTYNSPACERIHGFTPEELVGRRTVDLIHPEDSEQVASVMGWVLDHPGEPATIEYRYACKDGGWVWMEAVGVNFLGDPAIQGIVVNSRDVSERRRAQEALRESEATYRELLERQGEGFGMVDAQERFLVANPVAEVIFGVPPGGLVGRSLLDFLDGAQRRDVEAQTAERREGRSSTYQLEIRRPDGERRTILVTATPRSAGSAGALHVIGIFRDITAELRAQEDRKRLEDQVTRAQKMESLGKLAGGVAHDINNVLGAILGLASVHRQLQPEGSEAWQDLDTIVKACQRGGDLVKGLLDFARQGLADERALDLNALVRDQVQLLSRTTLQRVQLVVDLAAGAPAVRGDASALSHVLLNLCVNAVDAMAGEGTLTLRTALTGDGLVRLEVTDAGCGMTQEVLDRALDPFFTTKPQGQGTGLGLTIAYSVVKAHRGRMEIDSAPGRGTRVSVFLPVAPPTLANPDQGPQAQRPGHALSVLVVDDDELLQATMRRLLKALGHRATVLASGEEALQRLSEGLEVDLVILDLNMPGLGGAETLPRLRTLRPDLPVLLASGRVDQQALDLAQAVPGVGLMPKPFGLDDVRERLASFCRQDRSA
jgi:PAS domain S-box-containing protein